MKAIYKIFTPLFLIGLIVNGISAQETGLNRGVDPKAADLVIQGSIFELNGQYDKALSAFNEALIFEPNAPSIYYAVSKQYILLGKVETAVEVLRRSLKQNDSFVESHFLLAEIYHRRGQISEAEQHYMAVVRLDSANIDATHSLALIYNSRKEYQKAADFFQRVVNLGRTNSDIEFTLGNLYYQLKDIGAAYSTFRKYIKTYPDFEKGYLALSAVMLAQKDTSGVIQLLQETYDANPKFKAIRNELAGIFMTNQQIDSAIELYKEAFHSDTTDVVSGLRLGELYLASGDTVQALASYDNVSRKYPNEWRAPYQRGIIAFMRQDWRLASQEFEKSVALNKSWPDAWFRLGLVYQQENNLPDSERCFRAAQALAPIHPGVNINLGFVLFQLEKYDDALIFLEKTFEYAGQDSLLKATALTTIADVYNARALYEKSDEYYQKALKFDSDSPTILNNYGYSLAQQEIRLDEALEMVKKALEQDPENGAFLDTIGWVYFRMQDYEQALVFITKSIEKRDASAEVLEHLGDVYTKLGERERAVEAWQKAQELEPERESVLMKLGIN